MRRKLSRQAKLINILRDPKSFITTVYFASIAALDYDPSVFQMDPEALSLELEDAIGGKITSQCRAKLFAAQALVSTDLVYKDLPVFIGFCNTATARTEVNPDVFDPADAYEIAWGLFEMYMIDSPPLDESVTEGMSREDIVAMHGRDEAPEGVEGTEYPTEMRIPTFSDEIYAYIGVALHGEGAMRPVWSIPHAVLPTIEVGNQPELFAMAMNRTAEVEAYLADSVMQGASELCAQLKEIPSHNGTPLVSAEFRKNILESLRLPAKKD